MPTQSIIKVCAHCGAAFYAKAKKVRFCSRRCGGIGTRTLPTIEERFWLKVDKSGGPDACWPYLGYVDPMKGYGRISIGNRPVNAHRISFELANGYINPKLMVLHSCEDRYPPGDISSRSCCNPTHLSQGTAKENRRQMFERGRGPIGEMHHFRLHPELSPRGKKHGAYTHPEQVRRGSEHGRAKLTDKSVREIRSLYEKGQTTYRSIGRQYAIHPSTVADVVRRKNWKHVN